MAASLGTAALVLSTRGPTVNAMTIAGLVLALVVIVDRRRSSPRTRPFVRCVRTRRPATSAIGSVARSAGRPAPCAGPAGYALADPPARPCRCSSTAGVRRVPLRRSRGPMRSRSPPSMVVALSVTPALAPLWLRPAGSGAPRGARWAAAPRSASHDRPHWSSRPPGALAIGGLVAVAGLDVCP